MNTDPAIPTPTNSPPDPQMLERTGPVLVPRSVGVQLRPAAVTDAPRLAAVARAAYGHYVERLGYPPRPMTDNYDQVIRDQQVTVAELDGRIVGFVAVGTADGRFFIHNVAVDPSRQGAGVGRSLLQLAERQARQAGFRMICLYTHQLMSENLDLYTRIGYSEYARHVVGGAPLVYLRKPLP